MEIEVGCVVAYAAGKSGVVRFVGETDFAAGEWVGLELDRPDGKNNGELNGRVYFSCPPNHGLFCKKAQIKAVLSRPGGTPVQGAASSRLSMTAATTATSRLQQMRDRRASAVGTTAAASSTTASQSRPPSSAPSPVMRTGSSGGFTRSSSIVTPPSSSSSTSTHAATSSGLSAASGVTTSRKASPTTSTASSTSRLSLDPSARRPSLSRPPSSMSVGVSVPIPSASDEQLADARARVAKLEEELEQKHRHVEQLKQSLEVVREAAAAAAAARETKTRDADNDNDANASTETNGDADDALEPAAEEPMEVDEAASVSETANAAAEREAELLATLDAVKREADELVRNVRAEFEDHVAQLQREHEAQTDELRLENAAQASDVKALESELTQQRLRIAQFAAAEQKRAEEVAHAVAKQSTEARKVEALKAQLAELQDVLESVTLEKESLEMDKEIAEEHAEECAAEVEKLKAAMALAAAAPERASSTGTGAGAGASTDELVDENRKLRAAVKALHERASEEKSELNKKLRVAQREHTELVALREEVEQLTTKRATLESEVEELKEQLDLASAYETMVEDLTEKNLTLDERNAELRADLLAHEELKEVHEEMEHHHAEYEDELRAEIEAKSARVQELKQQLAERQTVVDDKDRTIDRFRDLAQSHRDEIQQLKAQLRAESGELASLKGTAHSALNQSMSLRALAAAAREHEAEAAKQRIHAEQAAIENAFFRALIPTAILSELDQRMLRVRLRLGRVAGKADILIQYLRKDLEVVVQQNQSPNQNQDNKDIQDSSSNTNNGSGSSNLLDSARAIQQLLLGEKLAAVACQAQEDLFLLECHLTTEDEFAACCAQLDTPSVSALDAALDSGLAAFADGTLLASRAGEATVYDRLVATLDDWRASRAASATTGTAAATAAEGFPLRCAVVKLRARKSVLSLAFALGVMLTFARSVRLFIASPELDASRRALLPAVDALIDALSALVATSQHLHRRAELDLAPSDEDLDGVVAVGGDAVELVHAYARESESVWVLFESELSFAQLQDASVDALVSTAQDALLQVVGALQDKVAALFKSVCRGAFTDAVAARTRSSSTTSASTEGRPQWRIRAHAIHSELLHASTLRGSLNDLNTVCQVLQTRIRELERSDSQHRVVTQKLESEVLRLRDAGAASASERAALEAQLTTEREQFAAMLDESHKEKAALDALNRELRKQLKRSSDAGVAAAAASASSGGRGGGGNKSSALSHSDAEAFRRAFAHLHAELRCVRGELATERLERLLGPIRSRARAGASDSSALTPQLRESLQRVSAVSTQLKAQLAMPRLVDLAAGVREPAHSQLVAAKLAHAKSCETLAALRAHVSAAVRADGWGDDVARAIDCGENVFGWQPPEMERPALLLSRVTLRGGSKSTPTTAAALPAIPLLLNRSEVDQLSRALVC